VQQAKTMCCEVSVSAQHGNDPERAMPSIVLVARTSLVFLLKKRGRKKKDPDIGRTKPGHGQPGADGPTRPGPKIPGWARLACQTRFGAANRAQTSGAERAQAEDMHDFSHSRVGLAGGAGLYHVQARLGLFYKLDSRAGLG
jgi:hypothetical protein